MEPSGRQFGARAIRQCRGSCFPFLPTHTHTKPRKKRRTSPFWTILSSPARAVLAAQDLTEVSYSGISVVFKQWHPSACVLFPLKGLKSGHDESDASKSRGGEEEDLSGFGQLCWPALIQKVSWDLCPTQKDTDTGGATRDCGLDGTCRTSCHSEINTTEEDNPRLLPFFDLLHCHGATSANLFIPVRIVFPLQTRRPPSGSSAEDIHAE